MAKKILVIDDEGLITTTVGNLLRKKGKYNTEIAESGLQAIEKIKGEDFDLIVSDIKMPELDGLETVTKIKEYLKDSNKPDVPVIFITAYADSDAHIKAKEFGKVIFKPFSMSEFLKAVADSLSETK